MVWELRAFPTTNAACPQLALSVQHGQQDVFSSYRFPPQLKWLFLETGSSIHNHFVSRMAQGEGWV